MGRQGEKQEARTAMGFSRRFAVASWLLVAVWACFIFFMSAHTGDDLNEGLGIFSTVYAWLKDASARLFGAGVDLASPLGHFLEYAVFGALLANALRCHMPPARAAAIAVLCASAYGASDEFHQLFVPDRACDPLDWIVDTVGAALGALLARGVVSARGGRGRGA